MSRDPRRGGATALAATLFGIGLVAAVVFTVVFAIGPGRTFGGTFTQLLGASLATAAAGIGGGLVVWARNLMPGAPVVQERHFPAGPAEERDAAIAAFRRGVDETGRRRLLGRMLLAALGALGIGALVPLRSLARDPFPERLETGWRRGIRLVDEAGHPIRAEDVEVNSALTVFPEGRVREADSQTILVRVPDGAIQPRAGREDWSPAGLIAYSKLCTHLGCPVGLYQTESQRLLCPCHQSAFDVLDGARPMFGPATRPLPQLPLEIDDGGFLIAADAFDRPVGPGFWSYPSHVRGDEA